MHALHELQRAAIFTPLGDLVGDSDALAFAVAVKTPRWPETQQRCRQAHIYQGTPSNVEASSFKKSPSGPFYQERQFQIADGFS